ncbi:hypothetical protein N864_06145 [Intrasporangium chromatireducens Q5-1]|uniref:OLD protein-like TOPRIM domain-containing protein n=1 Tax=Intrasporangium chromatireducens Q5-1 TaxID=584657 RepID=W9GGN5_9MICO|nr:TOPRIM nucleotidyl transferase/hydrolase domain-containing protein [Intrasporangium chromatireducens]EWT05235.1 hypothetical protein N864_06145 [Intrasporangium chromatireducens Q5-1]
MEQEPRRAVVLVEGRSDAVVVEALAAARGLDTTDGVVRVVAMGGVTNIRSHLLRHADQSDVHVLGLCDAPEERYVVRALQEAGRPVTCRAEMGALGFFVCVQDLEDELLRALGPEAVEDALSELGDLGRFRTFQRQPEWRGRPLPDQLHRFAGSGSGRKLALAARLARRLTPATTPPPLAALVDRMVGAVG